MTGSTGIGFGYGRQIKTYGTNYSQEAFFSPTSRDVYDCANAYINRGACAGPVSLDDCFTKFPDIKKTAEMLGFIDPDLDPESTGFCFGYTLWTGPTAATFDNDHEIQSIDSFFDSPTKECVEIRDKLGEEWLGCLWGTPDASFSCTCPNIGEKFEAYLKLRLNVATFWGTPKTIPVKRAEFLDSIKYGQKADLTLAGDFNLKIGQVVYLKVDGSSGYPYQNSSSLLNGYYYIIGIKHVITINTHETAVSISKVPPNDKPTQNGGTYAADYN
jgi:hypothetical protein